MLNQTKGRKRPLRTAIRQSLAKQQFEEQQHRVSSSIVYNHAISSSDHLLIPVPALEINAQDDEDSVSQYSLDNVQLYAIPVNSHNEDHAWRHSAPSSLVPFEVDEQLDDIVSSIENDLVTSQSASSTSRLSVESASEYLSRGSHRRESRPSDVTDEMRVFYEQERRRKDAHNDIEKRRREKIKDHIEELRTMVPGSLDFGDQVNSTSEILEATLNYVSKLQNNQKQMNELKERVEQQQKLQRRLIIQKQVLANLLNAPPPQAVATTTVAAAATDMFSDPHAVTVTTAESAPVDGAVSDNSMEYSTAVFNDVLLDHCNNVDMNVVDFFI